MNWQEKITVKKGNIGEELIDEYLIKHNIIPYSTMADGAHPFDKLCASRDKKTIFVAESKAKPARSFYPDTGIDIRHYHDYMNIYIKYNLDVFLFFIDEDMGKIYGNLLRTLDESRQIIHAGLTLNYPLEQGGIRYFPLIAMQNICEIPKEKLEQLKGYSTRSSVYTKAEKLEI